MYICLCNRVNDRQIQNLARQGVSTLAELQERTSLGTGCGCCIIEAEELLEECHAGNRNRSRNACHSMANSTTLEPAV